MRIQLTPHQDSENSTDIPDIILSESRGGKLMITLLDPDRELFLDRESFVRAYNALFPGDLQEYAK